jgi:hypothetical protein
MKDLEILLNLLRAIFLSILAPFNFFYSILITRNFTIPILFLVILFIGYGFGVASAVISKNHIFLGLFIMAEVFILASFAGKLCINRSGKKIF